MSPAKTLTHTRADMGGNLRGRGDSGEKSANNSALLRFFVIPIFSYNLP